MQPSLPPRGAPARSAPTFYLTGRQPIAPATIALATVAMIGAVFLILFALAHSKRRHPVEGIQGAAWRSAGAPDTAPADDEKDDPSQVDTIVLGDPADAPQPARRGQHVSNVHATILIHLPRFGNQVGLIPDSPAGRLLYGWLAAFNQASSPAMGKVLPNVATDAQMALRTQTGGFDLLSAREVQPGVVVFRLRDQTPVAAEVLGTLQVRPNSNPPVIASFSLRAVSQTQ